MSHSRTNSPWRPGANAFTLVELLVTMVIMSILAGLSLSGLAASRQRAKIDKTKSTIRKLHEIVMPQYESYLTRRVAIPVGLTDRNAIARARLTEIRKLMTHEMPDQWDDVGVATAKTAPALRYAAVKSSLETAPATMAAWKGSDGKHQTAIAYEGAECLALIVTRGGYAADLAEQFRTDEMGDIDKDGATEFWDGWGRPISFVRWPTGFMSIVQPLDASLNPDPFDPLRVTDFINLPASISVDGRDNNADGVVDEPDEKQPDYGVAPLIFSPGPDEALNDPLSGNSGYGIQTSRGAVKSTSAPNNWNQDGWLNNATFLTTRLGSPLPGAALNSAANDNITNHDLIKK